MEYHICRLEEIQRKNRTQCHKVSMHAMPHSAAHSAPFHNFAQKTPFLGTVLDFLPHNRGDSAAPRGGLLLAKSAGGYAACNEAHMAGFPRAARRIEG